jgi:predicted amidophosphoribosyltransferase
MERITLPYNQKKVDELLDMALRDVLDSALAIADWNRRTRNKQKCPRCGSWYRFTYEWAFYGHQCWCCGKKFNSPRRAR